MSRPQDLLPHRRTVGEIVDDQGEPLVLLVYQPDAPPVPATCSAASPPVGSLVELVLPAPPRRGEPRCQIGAVLARPDTALAELYRIAITRQLDPTFPAVVEDEVARWLEEPGLDEPGLEDLEHLPFVTIDDEHTRDLDQALYIERNGGGTVVYYALADASWYVRPGSALFDEALRRGASYYLPGLVIPMLPRALSEGLVSLNQGVRRRAVVFRMGVNQAGEPTGTTVLRARIRSRAKLSFERVQAFLEDPAHGLIAPPVEQSIELLRELGELRIRRAEQRHVVQYRRTEVDVGLGSPEGLRFVAEAETRGPVERYNEQLSLLCNMEGARLLRRGDQPDDLVQPIYRVHPQPDAERVAEFEALTHAVARTRPSGATDWAWDAEGSQSLASYLAALPTQGADGRLARAIHRQAVMLNVRSIFSEQAGGHYGVGADVYARFSSPMREIVGVFVHKEAWERVSGEPAPPPPALPGAPRPSRLPDEDLQGLVITSANRAKETQKRLNKEANLLVLDQLLGDDARQPSGERPWRLGTVMGLTRSRIHVLLDGPPIEVKVYLRHLEPPRRLTLDDAGIELRPDGGGPPLCRLGDAVQIQVRGRERRRPRWILDLRPTSG